jgi:hypothetical protein
MKTKEEKELINLKYQIFDIIKNKDLSPLEKLNKIYDLIK